MEINEISTGTIIINLKGPKTAQIKISRDKENQNLPQVTLSLQVDRTGPFDLFKSLTILNIKQIDTTVLAGMAGRDGVFSPAELNKLDNYLEKCLAISELTKRGLKIEAKFAANLSTEKSRNKKYLSALITLHKAGVTVDNSIVKALTLEKAQDPDFLKTLLSLKNSGILIENEIIEALDRKKAADKDFVSALTYLHKNGAKVTGLLIKNISLEQAKNKEHLDELIKGEK